ncbi:MAG TPA: cation transporter [Vicinamibacterales bacterium]|nr:cation transporter [Vicinamibacterales bacterium]
MKDCCEIVPGVHGRQRRVLQIVLAINGVMFVVELVAGLVAGSTALLADSVDMLGDTVVYSFSLYVVGRGPRWEARGALLKGGVMALFGVAILLEAAVKLAGGGVPAAEVIGSIGILALAANSAVLIFLSRHRADDLNMRSVWLCSRNDVIANVAVLAAAAGVGLTGAGWPDIAVGVAIALLFGSSAVSVLRAGARRLREGAPA